MVVGLSVCVIERKMITPSHYSELGIMNGPVHSQRGK